MLINKMFAFEKLGSIRITIENINQQENRN